ncbi:hypothetical protein EV207_1287 [Scopulibacillus darangshiensis]|uniref:Uncharacterized protein n=1 Tax=Scopulibacillus darangshiensis TaxID=442528 RepID=A0A4R2NQV6_9BACL|nr:hypothetical protein [Scopulibacillus darangshiensis]TCP23784.1 hypothetical protein EV207_1287 [Scopulibacillus darangshiensis]
MPFPSDSQFSAISLNGQPYFNTVGDESPASTDLVGNLVIQHFHHFIMHTTEPMFTLE